MQMSVEVLRVMSCRYRTAFLLVVIGVLLSHRALALDAQQVQAAQPGASSNLGAEKLDPLVVKIEILLDRAHFSSGEIDGKPGENVTKAVTAFAAAHGTNWTGHTTSKA
jgi:peptidoglycan hydrolase-like protein with peptidoglycan-binding domain